MKVRRPANHAGLVFLAILGGCQASGGTQAPGVVSKSSLVARSQLDSGRETSIASLRTKAELPPVIPAFVPPGPTVRIRRDVASVLSGYIVGRKVQLVRAQRLGGDASEDAQVDDGQTFAFRTLDPFGYRLILKDGRVEIRVPDVIEIQRDLSYRVRIEVSGVSARTTAVESSGRPETE